MAAGDAETILDPAALGEGDRDAIALLVAARGAALIEYARCVVGPEAATDVAAAAFGAFMREVSEAEDPHALDPDECLLGAGRSVVCELAAAPPSEERLREAERVYAGTPSQDLPAETSARLIEAMVEPAPTAAEAAQQTSGADQHDHDEPGTTEAGGAVASPPGASRRWLPDPSAPHAAPGDRPPEPQAPDRLGVGRRHHRGRLRFLAAVAVAAVGIAVVAVVLATAADDDSGGEDARPTMLSVAPSAPFLAAAARFEVRPTSSTDWAREQRERNPGEGRRWLTVAVQIRNIGRADLRPRALGYHLRTRDGLIIGPEEIEIPSDPRVDDGGPLPRGELTSVHLSFTVEEELSDLTLVFDAAGPGGPDAAAELGSAGDSGPADRQAERRRERRAAERRQAEEEEQEAAATDPTLIAPDPVAP